MQNIKNLSILLLAAFAFLGLSSCEEVIELDLNSSDPKVVIEGWILDDPGPYEVKITETVNYYGDEQVPGVSGAQVIVSDELGTVDTLTEMAPGSYWTNTIQGRRGGVYTLEATVNGEVYTATDVLPRINAIDTSFVTYEDSTYFFGEGYYVTTLAQEIPGEGDNYWFRFYQNDSLYNGAFDYLLSDDALVDGQLAVFQFPYPVESGDTVTIEVRTISETAYGFFFSFIQEVTNGGGPFGAPPANLIGNISNGGFGYFGAAGQNRQTVLIP